MQKFQVLSGRDQILKRPQMWIGSMDTIQQELFIISENTVERKTVESIPAFSKIINEILDNSLDALIMSKQSSKQIKVKISDIDVIIEDNGPGIPVIKKDISEIKDASISESEKKKLANTYLPEIAWGRLFSGSNFEDSPDKITVGAHGIGSKATAIFSTKFVGLTDDGKKSCKVTAKNNLETVSAKINDSSGETGTKVSFKPDLARFKLEKIEQIYKDLVYQRMICLSIAFPDINFSFNGKKINLTQRKFVNLFSENAVFQNFERGFIAVFPNDLDEFNFFSYVNGLSLNRGGNHIEYIATQIVNPIREKLIKRFKTIKPADIKNKISLIVFLRDFPNPKYDSQTKEALTNAPGEVSAFLNGSVDFDKITRTILRNAAIMDPIVETFNLKENVKQKLALKNAIKKVKIDANKYISPIGGKQNHFLICEGFSAVGALSAALGRTGNGFYASRGMPLNVIDARLNAIVKNAEFHDIMSILGIDPNNQKKNCEINFDTIVHANDSDNDGSHIMGIYMGWWLRFAPRLFEQKKIARLKTPYVVLWADNKMTKIFKSFFSLEEFKEYEKTHDVSKYKRNLFKGLGSWSKEQFQTLFESSKNGISDFLEYICLDEKGIEYINNWLKNDSADSRKEYLRQHSLDIEKI